MSEVRANGLTFHVQRLGEGARTLVFVHGMVMDNLSSWYFSVATPAAKHASVVLYDLRGHGRSERPESGYGLNDMVVDLTALLDELGLTGPVDLVGNSFGGTLALAFGMAHPERVSGMLLVDPHVVDASWGDQMATTMELEGEAAIAMIAKNFAAWKGRHSERKRNRLADNARRLVNETSLIGDLRASEAFAEDRMRAITCPVVAIYGEHSDIRERCMPVLGWLPNVEIRMFPGCTHSVLWEATEQLKQTVVDWARR